jgi:hypothetical protein
MVRHGEGLGAFYRAGVVGGKVTIEVKPWPAEACVI